MRAGFSVVSIYTAKESRFDSHVSLAVMTFWLSAKFTGDVNVIILDVFPHELIARHIARKDI